MHYVLRCAIRTTLPLMLLACGDTGTEKPTAWENPAPLASALLANGAVSPPAPPEPKAAPKPRTPPDPDLRIEVNVPAGRLDLYRYGTLAKSYPVSVGYVPHHTPIGKFEMHRVIWNPWWHPPESKWAEKRTKTAPGPGNPMGRAKLHLTELIYIHGSTATSKLGRPASHGCIRMANASVLELARTIAEHTGALDTITLKKLEGNSAATREVPLPRPIAVHLRYERAEIRNDSLIVHRDVYGRDPDPAASARRAWTNAGRDLALLTPEVMAAAVTRGLPPRPAPPAPPATPRLLGVPAPQPSDTPGAPVLQADDELVLPTSRSGGGG